MNVHAPIGGSRLPPDDDLFVGRGEALEKLHELLQSGTQIVTVLGPEGIGKSRLAARYAALHERTFTRDGAGVMHCDIADATSADEVVSVVLDALEVELSGMSGKVDDVLALADHLKDRGHILLVLDHADRARKDLAHMLDLWTTRAPRAQFLITAREPVRAPKELRLKLGPLRVPPKTVRDAHGVQQFEAVQLFVERAAEAVRGWTLKPADASSVAEIARRLGGVPMGIKIAAARLRSFSPGELLERLPSRVELLDAARAPVQQGRRRPPRPTRPRDASLIGTIEWSWRLLKPWEQAALAQTSVFRGGFSLEAAEAVIDLSDDEAAPRVRRALASLIEKSLLRATESSALSSKPRFVHYGPIRDFAQDQLRRNGEVERVRNRHASYYLNACEELAANVDAHGGVARRRELELETENLLAIVRSALSHEPLTVIDVERALRGLVAAEPVLATRGPFGVHLGLLDQALEPAEVLPVRAALLARSFESRGRARRVRSMMPESLADLERALDAARRGNDVEWEARALANIGTHHLTLGDLEQAEALYGEALPLMRECNARLVEGRCTAFVGTLHRERGDFQSARTCYEGAIEVHREVGDRRYEGITVGELGKLLAANGKVRKGSLLLERALQIHREVGNRRFEGRALGQLSAIRFEQQRYTEAGDLCEQSMKIHREVLDRAAEGQTRCLLGDIRLQQRRLDDARTHYDLAATLQQSAGVAAEAAITLAKCASVEATQGANDMAAETLKDAIELAKQLGVAAVIEAVDIYRAHVERNQPLSGYPEEEVTLPDVRKALKDLSTVPKGGERPEAVRSAVRTVNALRAVS